VPDLKVIVIDDHPLVCEGIKAILDHEEGMEMAGSAGSGLEAEQLIIKIKPDMALVDLRLPGESGIEIIRRLRQLAPDCRFVLLTTYAEPDDVRRAMEAGVDGYILKEALPEEMTAALRLVGRGRPYFDPTVMQMMLQQPKKGEDQISDLTERELEVLRALTHGLSNREIAGTLYVTEHTVKKHISSILSKLELKDRTQAALYAVSNGV
jgi:two-component system nitrate/nitrite response regulator NarL